MNETNTMERLKCPVTQCGADVLLARVKGETIMLDPGLIEVVVVQANGTYQRAKGYLPHGRTCLDISHRPRKEP